MKVSGIVYLIIGVFVVGFSLYIISIKPDIAVSKFYVFFLMGGLLMVSGLVKLSLSAMSKIYSTKKSGKKPKKEIGKAEEKVTETQAKQTPKRQCPGCGNNLRGFDKFCYRCGVRFRR